MALLRQLRLGGLHLGHRREEGHRLRVARPPQQSDRGEVQRPQKGPLLVQRGHADGRVGSLHQQNRGENRNTLLKESELIGSLKFGNVWVFVQLIPRTTLTKNQLYNIA